MAYKSQHFLGKTILEEGGGDDLHFFHLLSYPSEGTGIQVLQIEELLGNSTSSFSFSQRNFCFVSVLRKQLFDITFQFEICVASHFKVTSSIAQSQERNVSQNYRIWGLRNTQSTSPFDASVLPVKRLPCFIHIRPLTIT